MNNHKHNDNINIIDLLVMDSDGGMKGIEDHGLDGERRKGRQGGRGIDFPLRILVSSEMVGAIIGRGGATIRNITQESRARVDVHRYVIFRFWF